MAKKSEVVARIKKLQGSMNQEEFAHYAGVSQSRVSDWRAGKRLTADTYILLGNLAPHPENLWFWEQAGMSKPALLATAEKALREAGVKPPVNEICDIPCYGVSYQGLDDLKRSIPVATKLVVNPLSTLCLVVEKNRRRLSIRPGDLLLVDTSQNDSENLSPFWGKLVLVSIDTRPFFQGGPKPDIMTDLRLGILRPKEDRPDAPFTASDPVSWVAVLDSLDDSKPGAAADKEGFVVGRFDRYAPETLATLLRKMDSLGPSLTQEQFSASWPWKEIDEFKKEVREHAPTEIRLSEYSKILGSLVGWFRPPAEKAKK